MAHSDTTLAGHRRIQRPPTGRRRTLPHMGSLSSDTQVHGGGGRYSATPLDAWRIWGPMGGYAASFALRAAAAEVGDPTMSPASMTVQFFQPAAFEPVDIAVEVRRATRRTAATAVRITQEGRAILDAQVWFAVPDELVVHDHAIRHTAGDPVDHPDIVDLTDESAPFPFWRTSTSASSTGTTTGRNESPAPPSGRAGSGSAPTIASTTPWSRPAGS